MMFIAYSTVASLAFGFFGFLVGADYKETLAEEREWQEYCRELQRKERLKKQAEREREKNCKQTMKVFCNFKIV